jgi:hypothetical protein
MKFDLSTIFKTLGLPLLLVGVIVALLVAIGSPLEQITPIAASLVGLQLLLSLLIDVLKYAGVVDAGTSGKWSAGLNLLTLIGVVVWLKLYPTFDIYALDTQLLELGKVLTLVFAYITQLIGTKAIHQVTVNGLGIKAFAFPVPLKA